MSKRQHKDMHLGEVRELAQRFSADLIDKCMEQEIAKGTNPCFEDGEIEEAMNVLARSRFVRAQMDEGKTLSAAVRELGKRIRSIQG